MKKSLIAAAAATVLLFASAVAQEIEFDPIALPPPKELSPEVNIAFTAGGEQFTMTLLLVKLLPVLDTSDAQIGMIAQSNGQLSVADYALVLKGGNRQPIAIMADVLTEPLQKRFSVRDLRQITGNHAVFPYVWPREILDSFATKTRDLEVKHCRAPLDASRGKLLIRLWEVMLFNARAHVANGTVDMEDHMVDYHFIGHFAGRFCGGVCGPSTVMAHTESPGGKRPSALVDLSEAMRDYCLSNDNKDLARIDKTAAVLRKLLPKLPED